MKKNVRILVIGDNTVGKSSLICLFISRIFTEVPYVMSDTAFSSYYHSDVTITLMDSSNHPADVNVLEQKIRLADCIIALYDVNKHETLLKLDSYFLPEIQRLKRNQTNDSKQFVILCGAKTDKSSSVSSTRKNEGLLQSIMQNYPFVISRHHRYTATAKDTNEINSIFYHAETSVLFPIHHVYNTVTRTFTEKTMLCFYRVFRIFDCDNDGLLNDDEFKRMQHYCFISSGTKYDYEDDQDDENGLIAQDVIAIKQHIRLNNQYNASECIQNEGIFILVYFFILVYSFLFNSNFDIHMQLQSRDISRFYGCDIDFY